MTSGKISAAELQAAGQPAWQTTLVAFGLLFTLSEATYLILGTIAKRCLAQGATCEPFVNAVGGALFVNATNESGAPMFSNALAIGLPGFNNLFYALVTGIGVDYFGQFLASAAASVIIGVLVLWGYFALTAGRGQAMRLLIAIAFAIAWCLFYNGTEASIFGADFVSLVSTRYLEVPVGAASLFIASLFAHRNMKSNVYATGA